VRVLVVGGTRFFGIPMVKKLLENGHDVTVATRGNKPDPFGSSVKRTIMDKTDADSVKAALCGQPFDVLIDKVAYSSNDVRSLLSAADCARYIQMSSCAVYKTAHMGIKENEFDAKGFELKWLDRPSDYALGKRLAERAALEFKSEKSCVFVRCPVVLGENDYTGRLAFYAQHIFQDKPMRIENPDAKTSYIHEKQAGEFIAGLVDTNISGAVNACSDGTVSQRDIIGCIEKSCGKKAVLSPEGDKAPYDGTACDTSYDCTKAKSLGFQPEKISGWIYDLLGFEINKLR
jgi:nucleoside-diphosphate-sugar epimerase